MKQVLTILFGMLVILPNSYGVLPNYFPKGWFTTQDRKVVEEIYEGLELEEEVGHPIVHDDPDYRDYKFFGKSNDLIQCYKSISEEEVHYEYCAINTATLQMVNTKSLGEINGVDLGPGTYFKGKDLSVLFKLLNRIPTRNRGESNYRWYSKDTKKVSIRHFPPTYRQKMDEWFLYIYNYDQSRK